MNISPIGGPDSKQPLIPQKKDIKDKEEPPVSHEHVEEDEPDEKAHEEEIEEMEGSLALSPEKKVQAGRAKFMASMAEHHIKESLGILAKGLASIKTYIPSPMAIATNIRSLGLSALSASHDLVMRVSSSKLAYSLSGEITGIVGGAVHVGTGTFVIGAHLVDSARSFKELFTIKTKLHELSKMRTQLEGLLGQPSSEEVNLLLTDINSRLKELKKLKQTDVADSKALLEELSSELTTQAFQAKKHLSMLFLKEIPARALDISMGTLVIATEVGRLTKTIGEAALPILQHVSQYLWFAGAGLGVIFGIYGLQSSIRGIYSTYKERNAVTALKEDLNLKLAGIDVGDHLKILEEMRLNKLDIQLSQDFSKHCFKACLSGMVTVSSALAIAAAATHGTAAVGITLAGLTLAGISIGVQISGYIHQRKIGKEIEKQKEVLMETALVKNMQGSEPDLLAAKGAVGAIIHGVAKEIREHKRTMEEKTYNDYCNKIAHALGIKDVNSLKENPEKALEEHFAEVMEKK